MADIRIKDLPTTATQTASDDFIALDGTVNGTRKIDASAPSFKTSVTSPSIVAPTTTNLTLAGGSTGATVVIGQGTTAASATITPTGTGNLLLQTNAQIPTTGCFQINNTSGAAVWQAFTSNATTMASFSRSSNALLIKGGGGAGAQVSVGYTGEDLTLAGGSTGASLVLGQGNNLSSITTPSGKSATLSFGSAASTVKAYAGTFANNAYFTSNWYYDSGQVIPSSTYTTGAIAVASSTSANGGSIDFSLGTINTAPSPLVRLTGTGNLLIGTTTDSGNGKLQLATHTTSAGGIGFGTDLSLYRGNTGLLILNDASAALDARIGLHNNGTQRGLFEAYNVGTAVYMGAASAGWGTIITSGNQVAALTLASNQAATFAGAVTAGGAINVTNGGGTFVANSGSNSNQTVLSLTNGGAGGTNYQIQTSTSAGTTAGGLLIYDNNAAAAAISIAGTSRNVGILSTTPSGGAGSGALQVAGGIYSGAASVFGGAVTVNGGLSIPSNTFLSIGTFGGATGFKQDTPTTDSIEIWNKGLKVALISQSQMTMLGAAGGGRFVNFATGTTSASLRWVTGANGTAESGSNAGSDYQIHRYSDAGASLGTAFSITRATAAATFAGAVTTGGNFSVVGTLNNVVIGKNTDFPNYNTISLNGSNLGVAAFTGFLAGDNTDKTFYIQVGIGGGGMQFNTAGNTSRMTISNAGLINVTNTTPSTGAGSGALQVAGGIYSGAASVFGGAVTVQSGLNNTLSVGASSPANPNPYTTLNGLRISGGDTSNTIYNGSRAIGITSDTGTSIFIGRSNGTTGMSVDTTTGAATFAGTVIAPAATTAISSVRLPHGAAPTSPVNGDMWTTTAGLYVRINGVTVGPLS